MGRRRVTGGLEKEMSISEDEMHKQATKFLVIVIISAAMAYGVYYLLHSMFFTCAALLFAAAQLMAIYYPNVSELRVISIGIAAVVIVIYFMFKDFPTTRIYNEDNARMFAMNRIKTEAKCGIIDNKKIQALLLSSLKIDKYNTLYEYAASHCDESKVYKINCHRMAGCVFQKENPQ